MAPPALRPKDALMRIIHLANHADNVGNGIINVMVDLACMQRSAGHEVIVASGSSGFAELLGAHGVEHRLLRQRRRPVTIIKAARQFRALIREVEPDIVHAHMMTGAVLARVLRWNDRYRLVTTVHNSFQRSAIVMAVGDRVIAVSDAVKQEMERRGVPADRLRVVLNGPLGSPRKSAAASREPAPLHRPAIVTVAGLYERKGIAGLIRAFSALALELPDLPHLYIVGDGPDADRFRALAASLPCCNRIHFEGFQPYPEDYLRSAEIFVLASYAEPFGLVITEAREAGAAIIASDVGGIPEALDGGTAGILVPPGDSVALTEALCRLLESRDELNRWRDRASRNIQFFHVDRLCRETLTVYRELLPTTAMAGTEAVPLSR